MSSESTPLSEAHFRYIAAHTQGDDELLRTLKRDADAAGIPRIWISPEQASLMALLLRLAGARVVVEVGTLAGYSAITMARALPADGRVVTLEIEPRHADFARARIAASDVADKIEVRLGDGRALLPLVAAASADAMFLDADKESYACYLEEAHRIVRPGGLVLVDNALAFGELLNDACHDSGVEAIRRFNETLAADPRWSAVIVPLGDGLWVARRS